MLLDPDDPHYNALSKQYFGYKSSLIRNKIDGQVMEMYQPKLIEKGNDNLKMKEQRLRVPKSMEEFKQMKQEEQELKLKTIKRNKIYQAIAVENFETDESMKEIDFNDVCSDNDSTFINEADGDSGPGSPAGEKDENGAEKAKKHPRRRKNRRSHNNADRHKNISSHLFNEASNHTTALEHYNNLKKKN